MQQTQAVSQRDLASYRDQGFAYLRGIVPDALLNDGQNLIQPWVDAMIAGWRTDGLIDRDFGEFDFWHRFLEAWRAAGRPHFRRRPNRFLISPAMYAFVRNRLLLDIAERIIGTGELSVHGIFNARPQLPGAPITDTPWHQDSQYWVLDYGAGEPDTARTTHVMTMWIPLQPVNASDGALHVMSKLDTGNRIFAAHDYDYAATGYLGLSPEEIARYPHICEPMARGDALIFDQRVPHGAKPNLSERIRWSIDIRFEATATALPLGRKFGFVVQSREDPGSETSLEDWLSRRPPEDATVKPRTV